MDLNLILIWANYLRNFNLLKFNLSFSSIIKIVHYSFLRFIETYKSSFSSKNFRFDSQPSQHLKFLYEREIKRRLLFHERDYLEKVRKGFDRENCF